MAVSMKNTKKEIIDAYKTLEQQNKTFQSELTRLKTENKTLQNNLKVASSQKQAISKPQPSTTTTSFDKKLPVALSGQGGYQSVESVVTAFDLIKGNAGVAISGLSDNLTKEAANLAALQEESHKIEKQLSELHQIEEAQEETFSAIVEEYIEKSESFKKIIAKTQKEQLEAEELAKKEYEEAEDLHNSTLSEDKGTWKTKSDREREAYQYQQSLTRQQLKDETSILAKERSEELQNFRLENEKQWTLREKQLSEKEESYQKATQKAEELPKKLDSEVKRVYESTKGAIQRDAGTKANLLAKENEGKKRIAERQIEALSTKLAQQDKHIQLLNKQLTDALKEAKDLAIKAIDGASGAKSLAALKELAFEQNKQNGKK